MKKKDEKTAAMKKKAATPVAPRKRRDSYVADNDDEYIAESEGSVDDDTMSTIMQADAMINDGPESSAESEAESMSSLDEDDIVKLEQQDQEREVAWTLSQQ